MTNLEGFPLPATARHDEHGNHIPPRIKEWWQAADPNSPHYNPNRPLRGSEVERDQRQQRQFHEHLEEHRRLGQPAIVVEEA